MTACANCLKIERAGTWTNKHLDPEYFMKKPYVKVKWAVCPDCKPKEETRT